MNDTPPPTESTGERLRGIADELYEGNKSELARAVGMQPGSFSKYIRGERRPGATVLARLIQLGVNLNWIIAGEGPMLLDPVASAEAPDDRSAQAASSTFTREGSTYHPIPLVQIRLDDDDGHIQFDDSGQTEWLGQRAIRRRYGVDPARLRSFRLPCSRMVPTIQPGDRVRGSLVDEEASPEALDEGAPHLFFGPSGVFTMRPYPGGPEGDVAVVLRGDNPELSDERVEWADWNQYRPLARVHEVLHPL